MPLGVWWIERIVITDKRVMLAEGIVTHNVGMMPLSKVTDLTFRRTFGGRLLGYGTLIVESHDRFADPRATPCPGVLLVRRDAVDVDRHPEPVSIDRVGVCL